jgi:hypothetical protein
MENHLENKEDLSLKKISSSLVPEDAANESAEEKGSSSRTDLVT